jgi:hypothetical protein
MNEPYCNKLINYGLILRYITTVLFLLYLYLFFNKFIKKYIFLILPIALTIIDKVDELGIQSALILQYLNIDKNKTYVKCATHFYYQHLDKICDSISYILTFLFLSIYFKPDIILLCFIIYRIIGVVLFCLTRNSSWLVPFFDFIKEYLLYIFIFNKNYSYMPIFIFFKICFEFVFHTIYLNSNYKSN